MIKLLETMKNQNRNPSHCVGFISNNLKRSKMKSSHKYYKIKKSTGMCELRR